ncbi:hypothetical protein BD413DRAFT_578924 [Trametes elegans]|nr:hypothetical protein BD413DRAFT_578924 [Trametes elegans]
MSHSAPEEALIGARMSSRARSRNADVYIWWSTESTMIGCFNTQAIQPRMTVGTTLRWLKCLTAKWSHTKLFMQRADLLHVGLFAYCPNPPVDGQDLPDNLILEPGYYMCFCRGDDELMNTALILDPIPIWPIWSFGQSISNIEKMTPEERLQRPLAVEIYEDYNHSKHPPTEFHHGQGPLMCIFTGMTAVPMNDVQHEWIIPPTFYRFLVAGNAPGRMALTSEEGLSEKVFHKPTNVFIVSQTVYSLWINNVIGIDIHDNYRVCIFDSSLTANIPLPTHLKAQDAEPCKAYLHEHFLHTLTVRLVCSGPNTEYPRYQQYDFLTAVGIDGEPEDPCEEDDPEIDWDSPAWKTAIGQEFQRLHFERIIVPCD